MPPNDVVIAQFTPIADYVHLKDYFLSAGCPTACPGRAEGFSAAAIEALRDRFR